MEIGFHYGLMAPKLKQQAKDQGFMLCKAEEHQKNLEAIQRLSFNGFITDEERGRIVNRLHKAICKDCKTMSILKK